jgi:hypothetical protein
LYRYTSHNHDIVYLIIYDDQLDYDIDYHQHINQHDLDYDQHDHNCGTDYNHYDLDQHIIDHDNNHN